MIIKFIEDYNNLIKFLEDLNIIDKFNLTHLYAQTFPNIFCIDSKNETILHVYREEITKFNNYLADIWK